jgi:membrane protein implicated in regulation of membrane protease activity
MSDELESSRARRAANLFDLRRIIGGLFAIYGVILVILGLGASDAEIDKAAGWNLNLWVGIAMLVVAAIFVTWALTRPLSDELEESERGEGDRSVTGQPAPTGPDAAALAGSKTTRRRSRRDRE